MNTTDHKALAETYLAAISAGEFDTVMSLMADDLEWIIPGRTEYAGKYDKAGLGGLLSGLTGMLQSPIRIRATGMTEEGNRLAVQAESHAVLNNGQVYENEYHLLLIIEQGKIRRGYEYMDTLAMARVLGGLVAPQT